jgi:DnaJ-class molecular chaperone
MGLGRRNNDQVTTDNATEAEAPEALDSTSQEKLLKQPGAHTCPTCDGRGVRPEVSEYELCQDCGGSGTIEADK